MKKLLVLLLALLLALPSLGLSEGSRLDLKALDDGELLAHLNEVKAEYLSRLSFASFVLQKGEYRVGVDVPAGDFRVEHSGGPWRISNIILRDADGRFISKHQVFSDDPSGIGRLVLEDGLVLIIEEEAARFFAETGGITFE